jgi:hypothetical protein
VVIGLVALGILLIQAGSYWALSGRTMPAAAVGSLQDYRLICSAETILVSRSIWISLTEGQRAALSAELGRPRSGREIVVVDDLSESALGAMSDCNDRFYETHGHTAQVGCVEVAWYTERTGTFLMEAEATHYVGPTCAEYRKSQFLWIGFRWVRIHTLEAGGA